MLTLFGNAESRRLDSLGYPGNDWLAGIADPRTLGRPDFVPGWLSIVPGTVVEWVCHPGEFDMALEGRDGSSADGSLARRVKELKLLKDDGFAKACEEAGYSLVAPSRLASLQQTETRHAA